MHGHGRSIDRARSIAIAYACAQPVPQITHNAHACKAIYPFVDTQRHDHTLAHIDAKAHSPLAVFRFRSCHARPLEERGTCMAERAAPVSDRDRTGHCTSHLCEWPVRSFRPSARPHRQSHWVAVPPLPFPWWWWRRPLGCHARTSVETVDHPNIPEIRDGIEA